MSLQAYASILGLQTVFASESQWRDITSRQLALLLFADFLVYIYLDVWPYATQSPHRFHSPSDPATWIRIVLLTLSAVVIPLAMPRPFRPLTPGVNYCCDFHAILIDCRFPGRARTGRSRVSVF